MMKFGKGRERLVRQRNTTHPSRPVSPKVSLFGRVKTATSRSALAPPGLTSCFSFRASSFARFAACFSSNSSSVDASCFRSVLAGMIDDTDTVNETLSRGAEGAEGAPATRARRA